MHSVRALLWPIAELLIRAIAIRFSDMAVEHVLLKFLQLKMNVETSID